MVTWHSSWKEFSYFFVIFVVGYSEKLVAAFEKMFDGAPSHLAAKDAQLIL